MKSQSLLLFSIAFTFVTSGLAQAETKIGLIDFARIQREFYRTYEERENFESQREEKLGKVDEFRTKIKDLAQKQQERQKQISDPTLSQDAKDKILSEAQEAQGQIASLQREAIETEAKVQKELNDMAAEIQKSLTKQIYETIGTLSESKGLDLVFNRSFGLNGIPVVAYSGTANLEDFSDAVIAELNKPKPGFTPPVEEKK